MPFGVNSDPSFRGDFGTILPRGPARSSPVARCALRKRSVVLGPLRVARCAVVSGHVARCAVVSGQWSHLLLLLLEKNILFFWKKNIFFFPEEEDARCAVGGLI